MLNVLTPLAFVAAGLIVGLAADAVIEWLFAREPPATGGEPRTPRWGRHVAQPLQLHRQRWASVVRRISVPIALAGLSIITRSPGVLIAVALLSISCGMDFESGYIPPDGYMYPAIALTVLAAGITGNVSRIMTAFTAQAIGYGLAVLMIWVRAIIAGGDVKLAMQLGAVFGLIGTLDTVIRAGLLMAVATSVALLGVFVVHLMRGESLQACARICASIRMPLGPVMWLGVVVAAATVFWGGRGLT